MRNVKQLLLAGLLVAGMSSCVVYESHQVTGNGIGTKKGVTKSKIFGSTDIGVLRAAKNGKINKIATVDISTKMYLIFPITTVTVHGE